jgi:hypothetical protein
MPGANVQGKTGRTWRGCGAGCARWPGGGGGGAGGGGSGRAAGRADRRSLHNSHPSTLAEDSVWRRLHEIRSGYGRSQYGSSFNDLA